MLLFSIASVSLFTGGVRKGDFFGNEELDSKLVQVQEEKLKLDEGFKIMEQVNSDLKHQVKDMQQQLLGKEQHFSDFMHQYESMKNANGSTTALFQRSLIEKVRSLSS